VIKTEKIKLRRVMNELQYLYEEMELIGDLCGTAAGDFESYYRAFCAENNIDLKKLNRENSEQLKEIYGVKDLEEDEVPSELPRSGSAELVPQSGEGSDDDQFIPDDDVVYKELHSMFNKIFKKLAMKLHPDRIENHILDNDEKIKLRNDFSKARTSLEKKRYFHLVEISRRHGIYVTERYGLQLRWFKKERDNVRKHVNHEKCTYNYKFSECETDERKDNLIREFLQQLFGILV
jgi:hypothetical protein